jgi:vitamin B12 transporter
MKAYLFSTVALAVLAGGHPALAAEESNVSELVVSATRSPQRADRIGQSVTVIDAAAIKASQINVVSDLLAQTPGVSFSRNGGVGGSTSLRIRGAETDQTVVVIDGVKLNDPSSTGGGYNFANLMTGDISRIEILRGAQSTLWGSQAIGGVVNIVTAEPTKPFEGSASVEGGSMKTGYVRAGVGGATDQLVWRLAAAQYTTDGVSNYRFGTEKDGYRNTGLTGRAKVIFTDTVYLDLRAVYSRGRNEFDGFPAPAFVLADDPEYGITKDLVTYAGLNFDLAGGKLKNRIAYGFTRTDRDNYDPTQAVTPVTFDAQGENKRWEYQGVWAIRDGWSATFGAESEDAKMRTASPSAFTPNPVPVRGAASIDSVYGQIQGEVLTGLTLTAGLREDDHDTFGSHTTGQLAAAWALNDDDTILRASYGQGFKAPTLYQLFSQYGNTALDPESANAWDAGIEQRLGSHLVATASWFQRETRNQIDFVSCPSVTTDAFCFVNGVKRSGYYNNTSRAKAHGVELSGRAEFDALSLNANYTWTDAENDAPGSVNFGKKLTRRPEHQANFEATYVWPMKLSTGLAVHYVGDSFDNVGNTVVLKGRTLLDLRASYPINDTFELYGRVENVTDESYETTKNYGTLGRAAYLGVRATF